METFDDYCHLTTIVVVFTDRRDTLPDD